jgi:hypothetical protein
MCERTNGSQPRRGTWYGRPLFARFACSRASSILVGPGRKQSTQAPAGPLRAVRHLNEGGDRWTEDTGASPRCRDADRARGSRAFYWSLGPLSGKTRRVSADVPISGGVRYGRNRPRSVDLVQVSSGQAYPERFVPSPELGGGLLLLVEVGPRQDFGCQ